MEPIISIIVPIYNVGKYLPRCIDSILNQTFQNFELLIIDIGFVDPDDYIDKNMYEKLYRLCIDNNSDIAICRFNREINGNIQNKEGTEEIIKLNNVEAMNELFKGNLYRFSLCNKLFSNKCFNDVLFPEGRIHEDLSTTYRLFANSKSSIYINYCGYIYVKRENSILTSIFNEKRLQAFIGWDEIIEFMDKNYKELNNQVIATFTYWCMDNISYILKQVNDFDKKKKYLSRIKEYTTKYYIYIKENSILSRRYKLKIRILNLNYKLFIYSRKIRSIIDS